VLAEAAGFYQVLNER